MTTLLFMLQQQQDVHFRHPVTLPPKPTG